jgi:rRNA-processing protein FCF1
VRTLLLVDAENVRRSSWPNISREEFAGLCRRWAERAGVRAVVVFDGEAPHVPGLETAGSEAATADDRIVELAAEAQEPIWLVTSDRALRSRVGARAERTIGGGTFMRELLSL